MNVTSKPNSLCGFVDHYYYILVLVLITSIISIIDDVNRDLNCFKKRYRELKAA